MKIHLMKCAREDLYGWEGDLVSPEEYFQQLKSSIVTRVRRTGNNVHINKANDLILIDHTLYPVGYDVTKKDALKPGWHATVEWENDKHREIHLRTYLNGELHKTIPIYISGYNPSNAGDKVAHVLR